jgi:type IV pilus assembly protein PilM
MSLFHHNDEAFLGVDIGSHGIKLVQLKKNKGRPQLWTYGMLNEPLDVHLNFNMPVAAPEVKDPYADLKEAAQKSSHIKAPPPPVDARVKQYGELLKEMVKKTKVTTNRVTASLPVSSIFHAVITLPATEEKELEHHVKAKVQKMLPMPLEDMQVVHQKIPDSNPNTKIKFIRVLVTAAPRKLVTFYSDIFTYAGLQLQELETEAFALERSLVGRDTSTSMIIDIGGSHTNFFIVDQGLPITHRTINFGGDTMDSLIGAQFGVEKDLVSRLKQDISRLPVEKIPEVLFQSGLDPIIKEIQYSFDMYLHQTGNEQKRPEKIILTGGSSVFPIFANVLSQKFPMKVFVGDPWARVVYQQGLKSVLDEIGPRMSSAIGLAMRNMEKT